MEQRKQSAAKVPGYHPEHRTRFLWIIDRLGGLKKAAQLVGYKPEQVGKWRDGVVRPPLFACAALASAAGKSLDWLASGREVEGGFDQELMEAVIAGVYDYMEKRGLRARSGDDFQKLCMALYDLAKEDEGAKGLDLAKYSNVVSLATFQRDEN